MSNPDFSTLRAAMVSNQLRTNAINDPALLAALQDVSRELFVASDRAALAYVDVALPLGNGRALNAPLATAKLIQEAKVRSGSRVLLIGAGTGYAAALMAHMGATVVAVEEDAALCSAIGTNVSSDAVTIVEASLQSGAPEHGAYDSLVIDGAVSSVPAALTSQLKDGAAVATGLVESGVTRIATGRVTGGALALISSIDLEIPMLPGFAPDANFAF